MRFATLTRHFEELEATTARRALIEILARLFQASGDDIEQVVLLCQGRVAPFFEPVEIGMGEKLVAEAIAAAFETTRDEVLRRYGQVGDLGLVAQALAAERSGAVTADLTVAEVFATLRQIAQTAGEGSVERKVMLLADLLRRCDPVAAKHLTRLPLGTLRLGIGDPTILDGLALARTGSVAARKSLERAYNLTSDLGLIARTLWTGGLEAVERLGVQVGKPIRPALAERLPSAEAVIAKLGLVAVEPKFDGFRTQVHKRGSQIAIFSRNLENMTTMFPEIEEGARQQIMAAEAIVEGEAIAFNPESEEFYPFQETTKRRRKHQVAEMAQELPLRLFLFDLLYADGVDYTTRPYSERRAALERLVAPGEVLHVAPQRITNRADELTAFLLEQVANGLEGVVVKRLDAPYQAGARNFNWVKLKRTSQGHLQDTVDCVILGYLYGRGKRSALGAGALLAGVYDDERDEFVTICKIGTGLTDAEWREIRARCDQIMVPERPARVRSLIEPSVWVEPAVVIEVLADEITRSPIHTAGRTETEPGYALRFPRLVRFRGSEKRPEDATTVREISALYQQQVQTRSRAVETAAE